MTLFTKHFLPVVLTLTLASALSGQPVPQPTSAPSPAQIPVANPDDTVGPIMLRDESIDQVLSLLERWTGKTVLRPQALPAATITLSLKGGVTRAEAVRALETLLTLNGVAITPLDDKFLKITPLATAKSEAPELIPGSTLGLPATGRIASKMFQLTFLRVTEIIPQIGALLNPAAGSPPVIFEKANAALVTDSISNLQRVESLINQLDQPSLNGLQTKFYSLHYAKASDVVTKMHTVLGGALQNQLGSVTSYNPDDRTNQIVLIADPRQYPFFDDLIAKLDVKSDPNTRNEVIYLKHAASKDVASVLSQLVSGQNAVVKSASTDNVARANPTTPAQSAAPNQPAPPVPSVNAVASNLAAERGTNQFSSLLTILPDERTNSLVISGTVDDLRLISDLVSKIDILLAQVRIEVVVAEVSLRDQARSGIDALGLQVYGSRLVGINGSGSGTTVGGQTATSGGGSTAASDFLSLAGTGSLSGIVNLATTPRKSDTTIISQPTITTTHNKESKIFVGETRPTITGSTSSNASVGAANPYTTSSITQQEVGITMTVKPLIGNDGSVQLDVKLEISDVGDPVTIDGNVQNIILKRTTDQFITAQSGEIIVLGGLQRKSNLKGTSRLGPIPIIGDLLGTRTRDNQRTDLIFFLRPVVLTNTSADNVSTLEHVENLPKKQRDQVKEALNPTPTPVKVPLTMSAPLVSLPVFLRDWPDASERQQLLEASRDERLAVFARFKGLTEAEGLAALARLAELDVIADLKPDREALPVLPPRLVHEYQVVPVLRGTDGESVLHLATVWPPDADMVDWIATFTHRPLRWHLAPADRVKQLIVENYGVGSGSLDEAEANESSRDTPADANEADADAAVVRFVSDVITQAIEDGATDIHFEPQEGQLRIRYRVDGLLVPVPVPDILLRFQDAIISRLKIMARLNISERRLPQDGRINFKAGTDVLDIRVSTIPTIYAESVSLRLLNQKKEAFTMERLGMDASEQSQINKILEYPHGIILVTGPTGSGKSTSLNAFLRQINSTDLRIVTVEDPIEYEVPGVNQLQVRPEIGLTFASALRHVLRQDPDVIMVGEIRDRETADIAIRASLTGHLVLSTLHTNEATGAITRLIDMGIEPFLVTSAIELVIAQRLVRRLCQQCSRPEPINATKLRDTLAILGLPASEADGVTALQHPVGCDHCRGTGYRGRIGLFEILRPSEELHDLIVKRESSRVLDKCAREQGMRTLQQSGWARVKSGQTTLDEVLRVITAIEK